MERTYWLKIYFFALFCIGNVIHSQKLSADTVYPVIVDDYAAPLTWEFSRIGTNRGKMGNQYEDEEGNKHDTYMAEVTDGKAVITVSAGWGGIWTSLLHLAEDGDELDPRSVFGSYVKPEWQGRVTGVEADVQGTGKFKIELLDQDKPPKYSQFFSQRAAADFIFYSLSRRSLEVCELAC